MSDRPLSPPQAARLLGVAPEQVRAWIASGELRAWNSATRADGTRPRWKIDRESIEIFKARRAAQVAVRPVRRRRRGQRPRSVAEFLAEARP